MLQRGAKSWLLGKLVRHDSAWFSYWLLFLDSGKFKFDTLFPSNCYNPGEVTPPRIVDWTWASFEAHFDVNRVMRRFVPHITVRQ